MLNVVHADGVFMLMVFFQAEGIVHDAEAKISTASVVSINGQKICFCVLKVKIEYHF